MSRLKRHAVSEDEDAARRLARLARLADPMVSVRHPDAVPMVCESGHLWMAPARSRKRHARCPKCSTRNSSLAEQQLFLALQSVFDDAQNRADLYYRGRHVEVDVYLPRLRVGVEFDGPHHVARVRTDQEKNYVLSKLGVQLIRIRTEGLPPLDAFGAITLLHRPSDPHSITRCLSHICDYLATQEQLTNEERERLQHMVE